MTMQPTGPETLDLQELLRVLRALRDGDLSQRMPEGQSGVASEIATTLNGTLDQLHTLASEITRIAREAGTEGKLGGQADVPGVSGVWRELTDDVNRMAMNLTRQFRGIAEVTAAVAKGDLTRKFGLPVRGEILEVKEIINTMVERLNPFASEITRIVREIGTEGRYGGQADVPGVSGTWRDLIDNVNGMAANLTNQIRDMVNVTGAHVHGEPSRKVTVHAQGETRALKANINALAERLGP